jgi:hypothetical protein
MKNSPAQGTVDTGLAPGATQAIPAGEGGARWTRAPGLTLALTVLFLAFVFFPPASTNPRLVWTFSGVAGVLIVWQLILWIVVARRGRTFQVEFIPVKSHYVQAGVQLCILLYWGLYAREVYAELPLILAQVLFLYILDGLLSWSRGRSWRLGFGPLPIIFSTNLLLWFRDDWFFFQFLMVTIGVLAKQFITWNRDGQRAHIFNPSAFGQSLIAIVLIATATTKEYTWGKEIAATFETPHMLIVIFLLGLIVQYMFQVTLMTLAAVATLCLVNLVYNKITGTYYFVNTNFAAPIFLGVHLLVTDPSTSPRTNIGRVIFGGLYGLGYAALFWILDAYEIPVFWDKLLPVPLLNLGVPLIDRLASSGIVGAVNRRWESLLSPRKSNLIHMASWVALFTTMCATGFVEGPHPGDSIPFWKQAYADGKPRAGHSLIMAVGSQAVGGGSGAAFNELGLICLEGKIVKENREAAATYFARACQLGSVHGSVNVTIQFLFEHERKSDEDVARALDRLEQESDMGVNWRMSFLVGVAYETGRGRPQDKGRAIELYERCGLGNLYAAKGLARIALSGGTPKYELGRVALVLQDAADHDDAESCWYLAHMRQIGIGLPRDERQARALLQRACTLGSEKACDALKAADFPPYSNPRMLVPGWSTAFPMP